MISGPLSRRKRKLQGMIESLTNMSDSYGSPNQVKAFTQVQSPEEELKSGYDEDGKDADFTCVDRDAKQAIEEWIQQRHTFHPPSFIPIRQAAKDLSEVSCYPTLGIDATFPQHRATSDHETFAPAQAEYPVWYFLYGKTRCCGYSSLDSGCGQLVDRHGRNMRCG